MDGPHDSSLVDALVQVSFAVTAVLTKVASGQDLSLTQVRLLGILRDRTPTLSELAERLGLDRSSVTGLIDRAAARELVRRVPSEVDRRSQCVELTTGGHRIATDLAKQVADHIIRLTAGMSATDRASLNDLLRATSVKVG